MPSDIPLKEFIRRFKRHGVEVKRGSKSTHYVMFRVIDGVKVPTSFAERKGGVSFKYEKMCRKDLKLDHISDEEWTSKKKK